MSSNLSDRMNLAKAIHQLFNTENKSERDTI
jgi:hypothetical protein